MNRAVFLDRDGTINEDVGDFCEPGRLRFIPRALEALKMLQQCYALFVVTNQSGVRKNLFTERELINFNGYFRGRLEKEGINIRRIYYCPHRKEDNCACHKPGTYFLARAKDEYGIDLSRSYVVGDHPHDVEMGRRVGAASIYVLSGHGEKHRPELSFCPGFIAGDLYEAALWILDNGKQEA